jgi:hypothetical protein
MKHTAFARAALSRREVICGGVLGAAALTFAGTKPAFAQTISTAGATMQLTQEWDKTFPKSDKVDHQKVTRSRTATASRCPVTSICPRTAGSQSASDRHRRSFRRSEGAVIGPLCSDDGGARLCGACLRPIVSQARAAANAAQRGLARYQHRGFQRRGRLPRPAVLRWIASASA